MRRVRDPGRVRARCAGRLRYVIGSSVAAAVRRVAFRVIRAFSARRQLCGVEVWMMAESGAHAGMFAAVGRALELLVEIDPVRFARVRRCLARIVVADVATAYVPDLGACFLRAADVARDDPVRIASSIVHEATHAHVRRRGIPFVPSTWAREEILCVAESLRFLQRAPGGEALAAELRTRLANELALDRPWFTEERRWEAFAADMRAAGIPAWLIRLRRLPR